MVRHRQSIGTILRRETLATPFTPLRRDDTRRVIGMLDAGFPLSTLQSVARAAELAEVRLGCGPPSKGFTVNRTKAHVLADMRAAVGLGPLAVSMGTPMPTEEGGQPNHAESIAPPALPQPVPTPLVAAQSYETITYPETQAITPINASHSKCMAVSTPAAGCCWRLRGG